MKIGLDFDRVLFKTDEFKNELFSRIKRFGETYEEAKVNGVYNLNTHAEILDMTRQEILEELSHASEYLYEDIKKLQELRKDHELVIVTRGDPTFQETKLFESGVLELVEDYFIVQEGSKDIADIDLLVDDREYEIERVDTEGFLFDRSRHTLKDVVEKVDSLEDE